MAIGGVITTAYWGPVTMKHALALSLNNAAVWTLSEIGIDSAIAMAEDLGIGTLVPEDRHLGMALGGLTKGVTPLALAASFVPFANGGLYYQPRGISRVSTKEGRILEEAPGKGRQVLTPQQAYLMTDMLKAAMEYGTGQPAAIDRPTAARRARRTTLSAFGLSVMPQLVTCVYVGNDGNACKGYGGTGGGSHLGRFHGAALKSCPGRFLPEVDARQLRSYFSGGLVVPARDTEGLCNTELINRVCPLHRSFRRDVPAAKSCAAQDGAGAPKPPVVPPESRRSFPGRTGGAAGAEEPLRDQAAGGASEECPSTPRSLPCPGGAPQPTPPPMPTSEETPQNDREAPTVKSSPSGRRRIVTVWRTGSFPGFFNPYLRSSSADRVNRPAFFKEHETHRPLKERPGDAMADGACLPGRPAAHVDNHIVFAFDPAP